MSKLSKKLTTALILVFIVSVLAGCGSQPQSATFIMDETDSRGVYTEMVLEADGDEVKKMTQTTTISLEGATDEQIDVFMDEISIYESEYGEIDGAEYSHEIVDEEFIEEIQLNIGDTDTLNALTENNLLPVEEEGDYISFDKTKENLVETGWELEE